MNLFEAKLKEVLEITDPRQAAIKATTIKELDLLEIEKILLAYQEKYNVKPEEMFFYPNGEKVLTAEMFW